MLLNGLGVLLNSRVSMKVLELKILNSILLIEYFPGLIGGSLDVAHSDVDVLFGANAASGKPLKLLSVYRDKEWWIMGVAKGINSFEDLKGGKISGGGLGGRNTWIQRQILIQNGIDPDKDVEMVPMKGGSDGRMKALIAGVLQGASVFPRHENGLTENGGKFISAKIYEVPQEGFITNMEWGDKNEDALYAWQYAELKARQWLFDPANKAEHTLKCVLKALIFRLNLKLSMKPN
jgi:ABC-type nitrate/sulfonate/bicarbonate transport system substrate-binding protein